MVKIIGCDLHWASLMHKKKVICKKAQEHSHFMWEKIVHFSLSLSLVFATGQLLYVMICIHYGFASKLPVKRLQLQKAMAFIEHGNRLLSKSMAVFFFCQWDEEKKKKKVPSKWNLICVFLFCCCLWFVLVKAQFKYAHNCDDTLHCGHVRCQSIAFTCHTQSNRLYVDGLNKKRIDTLFFLRMLIMTYRKFGLGLYWKAASNAAYVTANNSNQATKCETNGGENVICRFRFYARFKNTNTNCILFSRIWDCIKNCLVISF